MTIAEMQTKQVAFLESLQASESFNRMRQIHVQCKTCHEAKDFFSAGSVIDFIGRHRGHYTWVTVGRGTLTGEQAEQISKPQKPRCEWCARKWKEIDELNLEGIWDCPVCGAQLEWGT